MSLCCWISCRSSSKTGVIRPFGSADAACAFLQEEQPQLDLLFTDVRMPGVLSGIDLALQARCRQASLPIVITSGYCDENPACAVHATFLPKPWDPDALSRTCPVNSVASLTAIVNTE